MRARRTRRCTPAPPPAPPCYCRKLLRGEGRWFFLTHIDGALRSLHHAAQHRHEGLERHGVVIGIEGVLVVAGAEHRGALEAGMPAELLTHVPVEPEIVEEIVALEDAVMLQHPVVFF